MEQLWMLEESHLHRVVSSWESQKHHFRGIDQLFWKNSPDFM